MDTVTREETKFIQKVIIFAIIPIIVFVVMKVRLSKKSEVLRDQITEIEGRISDYLGDHGTMPTLQRLAQIEIQLKEMEKRYETISSFIAVPPITLPEGVIEKGVYFKKQLYMTQKGLAKKGERNDVKIPQSLGFGDELPRAEDIPLLLRKLETIDKVLSIIIANNAESVTAIKLLDDRRHVDDTGEKLPLTEISIRVDTTCKRQSLVQILYGVGILKPLIVTKDIGVHLMKEGVLEASFVFSRLVSEL